MSMRKDASIRLDLNSPEFQKQLFALEKSEQRAVLNALRKLTRMTWQLLYRDSGFNWEVIISRQGPHGG
ncbi:MAG TPA: hypothetical protein VFP95_03420, partial [Gammaproteobacteria bacterium]|nr:hypothetical protein [Gammaproteobacteria bacterium]